METSSSSSPSSTPTLPMVSPAGQPSGLSKMHQEPAGPDGLPIEAAPNKSSLTSSSSSSSSRAIPIPQSRDSIYLRRDKDIALVNSVLRTDSIDSYRIRRSDTTFSARTYITDATELDPPSPGADDFHDEPELFEDSNQETYASSPRPLGRTVTFYQDNCRPQHCSSSPDNTSLPMHSDIRRLQNRSSSPKRGILRSSTGFNPSRPSSVARRGSSQWPGPLAHRPRVNRWTTEESDDRASGLPESQELPTPTESTPTEPTPTEAEPVAPAFKPEEHSDTGMLHQIQQDATEDVGLSSLSVEDTQADEAGPEEMSDSSDSVGDIRTPSSTSSGSKPDDQMVQDTCNHVLRNVFGVDLQELGVTGAASAAYNSVHYCLDELSQIVPAENSVGRSTPPLREAPGTTRGGGHAPIRPGNGGDYSNCQIGGGAGGGRGSQKRSKREEDEGDQPGQNGNGNGGGNGPGGRDNGGGGKRPKVAASEPSEDQKLSCPFRKRNPVKFNVRDHQSCAVQSFPDISQLKRHVKNFHKQKSVSAFACPRCKQDMMDKEGLEYHLAVPNESICTPQEAPLVQDPEDGITSRIEDVLNGRKANTKIDTWEVLWPTLFPEDLDIPDSRFVPPVELEEVHCQFQYHMADLESRIRETTQDANNCSQSLEDRVAMILESFSDHIKYVFEMSRLQADSGPGRPRRIRSHGHGQNPKSAKKGKSPDTGGSEQLSGRTASPIGRRLSSQHPIPPEAAQPQPIPKKGQGQRLSVGDSNLSSSFDTLDTANSDDSWVHTQQPSGQEAVNNMPMQPLDQYVGLNLETSNLSSSTDVDEPLSALTTGPAGSPAYLVSPSIGHGGGSVIPPPQQVHFRNAVEHHGLQIPNNGNPSQTPVTGVLASQLHSRADQAIPGAPPTFFRAPVQTFQNPNTIGIFSARPSPFQANPPTMGYGQPTAQQLHPQQVQQMQMEMQMQMRFRQAQAQAQNAQQQQVRTIDPKMISNNFVVGPPMGMGNNGNNNGHGLHGFNPFSPGGGGGTN